MKKASVVSILLGVALLPLAAIAEAQQPKKIPRVGFITGGKGPSVESFQRGLRDLGYTEGKNILVEYRYIEEKLDHVPTFVAELVQLKVDALVVTTLIGIRAVKQATKTI